MSLRAPVLQHPLLDHRLDHLFESIAERTILHAEHVAGPSIVEVDFTAPPRGNLGGILAEERDEFDQAEAGLRLGDRIPVLAEVLAKNLRDLPHPQVLVSNDKSFALSLVSLI